MPRKEKKFHFMYKTTNIVTGKYYYGIHSTSDLDDGYLGSGKRLRCSINKYGKKVHQREVLELFDNREDLANREAEIVNLNEISKDDCMNIQPGGGGRFINEEHRRKFIDSSSKGRTKINQDRWIVNSDFNRKRMSEQFKALWKDPEYGSKILPGLDWTGRSHSEETKQKIKDTFSKIGHQLGSNNSQYGKCWIYNEELKESKRINKGDLISEGWKLGRKLKF